TPVSLTRRLIRAFRIRSGWSFNSTQRKTLVRRFCIPNVTRMVIPGKTSAGPGGPAKSDQTVLADVVCRERVGGVAYSAAADGGGESYTSSAGPTIFSLL